jgi:hypothetical protein
MPPSSDNAMVPVDGVSPSSSTHPSLLHPNTTANTLIPNALRTVILKLFLVKSYVWLIYILSYVDRCSFYPEEATMIILLCKKISPNSAYHT